MSHVRTPVVKLERSDSGEDEPRPGSVSGADDNLGSGHVDSARAHCCKDGRYFCDAIKAMITRQIFLLHTILAVWQVTLITADIYWLICLTSSGLIIETLVVLFQRRGQEWGWFQWSVFLYLLGIVPPIWILELHKLGRWIELTNSTIIANSFNYQIIKVEGLIPFQLAPEDWVVALEQTLLVVIISGRWLMPKGDLTRDQLSGLLLVHLGTASDIVDFLTLLAEEDILDELNSDFVYAILAVWTWSLFQFPFVVTAKKKNDEDEIIEEAKDEVLGVAKASKAKSGCAGDFLETEAWGIFVSVLMQDGPFVIMRLTAILRYRVVTYTNYFFAFKNSLMLMLQVYRLISIYHEHEKAKRAREESLRQGVKLNRLYNKVWDTECAQQTLQTVDAYTRRKRELNTATTVL